MHYFLLNDAEVENTSVIDKYNDTRNDFLWYSSYPLLIGIFLDPRGGSLSLIHVVVLLLLLVDFFVSQHTVFIETS